MEEDIKTIQEKLKIIQSLCTDDCINKSTVIQPLIYAIENLIARNKDLEKNYINPNKARISYFDKGKGTKVVIEGFIPKSKVQEKIEHRIKKLEKMQEEDMKSDDRYYDEYDYEMTLLKSVERELIED